MRLHPRDIKVDDVFWECYGGFNDCMRCLTAPIQNKDDPAEWTFDAINVITNKTIHYLHNDDYLAYAPRLYDSPQYGLPLEKRTFE